MSEIPDDIWVYCAIRKCLGYARPRTKDGRRPICTRHRMMQLLGKRLDYKPSSHDVWPLLGNGILDEPTKILSIAIADTRLSEALRRDLAEQIMDVAGEHGVELTEPAALDIVEALHSKLD